MISVVIPCFNTALYLERAIVSVLAQTFTDFEIVVVDDGSTDDTVAVAQRVFEQHRFTRFQLIQRPHCGPGATRNVGIRAANQPWIAFLDSDDYWMANKLEAVADAIRAFPDVDIVCHYETEIRLDGSTRLIGNSLEVCSQAEVFTKTYHRTMFTTSGVTARRASLEAAGMFDETLPSAQDRDLWIRLVTVARPFWLRESLGYYVNRLMNISSNHEMRFACSLRISKQYRSQLANFTRIPRGHVLYAVARCRARAVRHYLRSRSLLRAAHHTIGLISDCVALLGPAPTAPLAPISGNGKRP